MFIPSSSNYDSALFWNPNIAETLNSVTSPKAHTGTVSGWLRAATDESQKTLNKCETRNKTVFDTRLRHPETINSVPLNSVLRIKQTCV